jgi:hypothetical protein
MKTDNDKQILLESIDLLRDLVNSIYEGTEPKPKSYDDFTASYRRYRDSLARERPAAYLTGKDFSPNECKYCKRPSYGRMYCADCLASGFIG